jgi:hypothetical protein
MSTERTEPKFQVGQVVMVKGERKPLPFRIVKVVRHPYGNFYMWNATRGIAEGCLRPLTDEEKGV